MASLDLNLRVLRSVPSVVWLLPAEMEAALLDAEERGFSNENGQI